MRHRTAFTVAFTLAMGASGSAWADALVAVTLKDAGGRPADGTVILLDAGGKAVASCEARGGSCEMHNVAGGSYTVTVKPAAGDPPKPRKVMIPPTGRVTLV